VDDVERVVDELSSGGVTFEHYEELTTNEKGISPRAGGGRSPVSRIPTATPSRSKGARDGQLTLRIVPGR
jgi:hypothetical protein